MVLTGNRIDLIMLWEERHFRQKGTAYGKDLE